MHTHVQQWYPWNSVLKVYHPFRKAFRILFGYGCYVFRQIPISCTEMQ